MASKPLELVHFSKRLLNRSTCSPNKIQYIEASLAIENESADYSFHKIMVTNWTERLEKVFDAISDYYGSTFIPVNCSIKNNVASFYTSSSHLVMKIIKFDFQFPYSRHMFDVQIMFKDQCSLEFFGNNITLEEIVSSVVTNRFSESFVLDLSNFCNDKEFKDKKIYFYELKLLVQFKILMLRMGKVTKSLNLSNNNLSKLPTDILNFFMKSNLVAIDLSNNNISSLHDLLSVNSKIERLWVEGNPLCDDVDVDVYIKNILLKFPRLCELDGINIRQNGFVIPFNKTFLVVQDKMTEIIVDKFLTYYFSHYDDSYLRKHLNTFYSTNATLSFNTTINDSETESLPHLKRYCRNILHPDPMKLVNNYYKNVCVGRKAIMKALRDFPETIHDPTTFTVDVLMRDKSLLTLVVQGVYKEISIKLNTERLFQFSRTFVLRATSYEDNELYQINNEIFSISTPTWQQAQNSFKHPIRNLNSVALIDPDEHDVEAITNLFSHITKLKPSESLLRLKAKDWNINLALSKFARDLKANQLRQYDFVQDDDFTDTSSLMDDID